MDVRCDRCQTEYEIDEMRLTASGVAVKCTNCGNVFKVKRASAEEVVPAKKVREWHVRRQDGTTLTLRELTELQKAVVERRVAPEDSVSLSGESWHQLGSMPELASFFEVVQAANLAMQRPPPLPRAAATAPTAMTPQQSGRSGPPTQPWGLGPQALGAPAQSADPAWAAQKIDDPELTALLEKEDMEAVKSGRGIWVAVFAVLLCAGGAAAFYFLPRGAPGTIAMAPPKPPDVNAPIVVPPEAPKPTEAPAIAAVPPPAAPTVAPAAPPASPTPAAAAPEDTKVAVAPTKPAAKSHAASDEDEPSAPSGKGFDYYISQGHHLLDSQPARALALFEKAAELDPASPEPDSGRGLAYANMERLGDAASAFQTALTKSSEFTEAIMGLAEVSREQGNARKAYGLYQRYLDLAPDGTDAPVAHAQLQQLKGELTAQAPAPQAVAAPRPAPAAYVPPPPPPPPPQQAAPAPPPPAPPIVVPPLPPAANP